MGQKTFLSGELTGLFENFYQIRLSESGGARNDEDELAIARDILTAVVRDGLTPTADGGVSYVRRGAQDWTDPGTVDAARALAERRGRQAGDGGTRKDLLMGLAMLLACVAGLAWFLWPKGEAKPAKMEATVEAQATPEVAFFRQATLTPAPALEAELLADIVDASGVKTGLVVPRTLEVSGVSFVVQPVKVTAGDWELPGDERAVSWVFGTVINYVLGLEATAANKTLLARLQPGAELVLRTSTGPAWRFAFVDLVRVPPQVSEVFRQNRPGLTLALVGAPDEETRIVARAVYLPQSEVNQPAGSENPAALGEPVVLQDALKLVVVSHRAQLSGDEPGGFVSVAVGLRLENRSGRGLPATSFSTQVTGAGMTFPPQAIDGLPETLAVGAVVSPTLRYVLPENVAQSRTVWQFSPVPGGEQTRVALPALAGPFRPVVNVADAAMRADGRLEITLRVSSPLQARTVTGADIAVDGGALFAPVDFRVEAGQESLLTLPIKPLAERLTLTVLGEAFEISLE